MSNIKTENKIEHLWTIICSSASVDNETNSVSLFNIIEEMEVNHQPTAGQIVNPKEKKGILIPVEIVSMWRRIEEGGTENLNSEVQIHLLDPDNLLMQEMAYNMQFKPQHQRMRMRAKLNGINITKGGTYYFSVRIKEEGKDKFKEISRMPLLVKVPNPVDLSILKK